jgi:hypothetical protein
MLTLWGAKNHFCDRVSRRDFLQIGAFGAGLTLADMWRLQAIGSETPARRSKRSAIMIFLRGGPPHLDMYDMKPEAPQEIRGEFSPIATNVAGVNICELMPLQAKMWDKFAVLRAVVAAAGEHSDSEVLTGYSNNVNRTAKHPSFGSVVSKLRSSATSSVPQYVNLGGNQDGHVPGYLGAAHGAFTPEGPGIQDLRMVGSVDGGRLDERKALLAGFDTVRRDIDASGAMVGLDAFKNRAFEMIASGAVRRALDLSQEPEAVRERYAGVEQFLTARRLVEAGVGCVTMGFGSWDTHANNFSSMRYSLPRLDRGVANLVQDLHDRGLGDDVVTCVWGEFGRSPKINTSAGREHWPPVMSALIAGGGLKMGQAIGATNARGEYPLDGICTVQQVLATLYHSIGIDAATTFPNGSGRPTPILEDRELVRGLV